MARKLTPPPSTPVRKAPGAAAASKATAAPAPIASTPVRNSPMPKSAPAPAAATRNGPKPTTAITHDMIAARAYEISCSPDCGSEFDNWIRAERELRGV